MPRFVTRRTVEFSDTDMGGVVHFSRYHVYMETAEHQFLASRGVNVHSRIDDRLLSWPRVSTHCEYLAPARYRDEIEIAVRVVRRGGKSVTYGFEFSRDGTPLARGEMTAVCCVVDPEKGTLSAVAIPDDVARKIGDPEGDGDE